jgi:hypothetical protein
MNNKINNFLRYNKILLKKNNDQNSYIALCDRGNPSVSLLQSILISAYCNKFNFNPIILSDYLNANSVKIFKSFGFLSFVEVFNYKKIIFFKFKIISQTLLYFFYSIFFIIKNNFEFFIKNYKISEVLVGDLIYDQYIRHNLKFIKPKIDFSFLNILFKSIFRMRNIISIVNYYNFKVIFVGTEAYATNNSFLLRVGLKKNIPCYLITGNQFFLNKFRYKNINIKLGSWSLKSLGIFEHNLKKINIKNYQLNKFITNRFYGKVNTLSTGVLDLINANSQKSFSEIELFKRLNIKKNNFKKIVLVAPHAFSDAPHVLGTNFIFRDYYDHFFKTLKFLNYLNYNEILWLIRPHPSSRRYNEEGIIEKLINKVHKDNILYCPKELVNTQDLIKICDNVITGRGTIGLEFACHGKYPILSGSASYSGYGFAIEPRTKSKYFNIIKNILLLKPMSKKKVLLARKCLFYLETKYPKKIQDIKKKLNENRKVSKIFGESIMNKSSDDLFSLRLIDKIKKKSFEKDVLYKEYLKELH